LSAKCLQIGLLPVAAEHFLDTEVIDTVPPRTSILMLQSMLSVRALATAKAEDGSWD
jgi:hypothetical protein